MYSWKLQAQPKHYPMDIDRLSCTRPLVYTPVLYQTSGLYTCPVPDLGLYTCPVPGLGLYTCPVPDLWSIHLSCTRPLVYTPVLYQTSVYTPVLYQASVYTPVLYQASGLYTCPVPCLWSIHLSCTIPLVYTPVLYQASGLYTCPVPGLWSIHLSCTRHCLDCYFYCKKERKKEGKKERKKHAHAPIRGQCLGPTSVCFVESSIFTALA